AFNSPSLYCLDFRMSLFCLSIHKVKRIAMGLLASGISPSVVITMQDTLAPPTSMVCSGTNVAVRIMLRILAKFFIWDWACLSLLTPIAAGPACTVSLGSELVAGCCMYWFKGPE